MLNSSVRDTRAEIPQPTAATAPKVVHLIGSFDQGGSERQAVQLAGLLQESGSYSVRLASLQPTGILRHEAESLGFGEIPSYPLTSFYDRNFVRQVRRFACHLRALNIAVVHTHEFYSNIFGMLAAGVAGVPVRIASRRDLGTMRSAAQSWVERRAYGLAHSIVVNSDAIRRHLIRQGVPPRKLCVVYNGLDMNRLTPRALNRSDAKHLLNIPEGEGPLVTLVANFRHTVKDQPTFLRAAKRVHMTIPSARFVLAGEGDLLPQMRAFAEQLGISSNVWFTGRCDHVAELLALSSVCVLSSTSEGFSNAILEYMAAARPAVVTDVGGARECVVEGETGYLVNPGDDASMAARILVLLQNPERAEAMGKRGQEVVQERFSKRNQLERTEELYRRLLAAPRTRHGSQRTATI